jgi:5-hydroxyisourate hydrolase
MKRLSTHVLDTTRGQPASGIVVVLECAAGAEWKLLGQGQTDADGRIPNLIGDPSGLPAGDYRLRFATAAYFHALGMAVFYPEVQVHVRLGETSKNYHLPLLLSPYGYTTYRGS